MIHMTFMIRSSFLQKSNFYNRCAIRILRFHLHFLAAQHEQLAADPGDHLKQLLESLAPVLRSGHSLGGALAHLAAYDIAKAFPSLTVRTYTFGSPRCELQCYMIRA